jgi:hypothetical protein
MQCEYEEIALRQSWTGKSGAVPAESFTLRSGAHKFKQGTATPCN